MRGRDRHDVSRFVASLVTLGVVAVAVPAALVAVSRARFGSALPLHGVASPTTWRAGDLSRLVSDPLSDGTVVDVLIRSSLCVIWIATAVILLTSVAELGHVIRHRGIPLPPVRGLGWAQRVARFIVFGLVVILPMTGTVASIAQAPVEMHEWAERVDPIFSPSMPAGPLAGADGHDTIEADGGQAPPASHVVAPGESIYSIAARLAGGDEARVIEVADAIIDANLGRSMNGRQRFTNPAYIEAGWELVIPSDLAEHVSPIARSGGDGDLPLDHRVEVGDTLWDIADDHLGDPTRWTEIWQENAGDDMGGGRTFDDPDLILPGWELDLPDDPPGAPLDDTVTPRPSPTPLPSAPPSPAPTPTTSPPTTSPTVDATVDATVPVIVLPSVTTPSSTTTSSTTTSSTVPVRGTGGADAAPAPGEEVPDAPSPIRLEHAALLAAGILTLVGVRRRQRLRASMPRSRIPEPPDAVVATERRLRTFDAGERAARIDVACRSAAYALLATTAQIGWVQVSGDGLIVIRLSAPADLPPPWIGGGQSWQLPADVPIEMMSEAARQVGMPCVALVQLGVSAEGDDVLVDLEACGVLAVEASPPQADEVVTAVATGLSSSLYAEVAHLIAVSLPAPVLLGHRNAHRTVSVDAGFELAAALVGSTLTHERSTFVLRSLRTGGEVWEPAVMLLRHDDGLTEIDERTGSVPAGHGMAVVAAVEPGWCLDAPARLTGFASEWRLEAFGSSVALTPIGLSQRDVEAIVEVLADASVPLEREPDRGVTGSDTNDRGDAPAPAVFEPMDHEIVVHLMGSVEVTDRHGRPGQFERSKTVELIAWLVTHRDRATRMGARTALWELDVRDATFANVVSEARRALGRLVLPPDGEEWLARTLTALLPLHAGVVSDAQLVQERLDHARLQAPQQAVNTLRPAVAMIRDMPFAGTSYLWPDSEGITSDLVLLAITTAAEFAAHALSLGDADAVFWATGLGLRVLPGHEELIGLRMRAHARNGDLAGVRQEWESYERVIVADAWSDGEPAPKLLALRRDLLTIQ
jgi:hypothetical protein